MIQNVLHNNFAICTNFQNLEKTNFQIAIY